MLGKMIEKAYKLVRKYQERATARSLQHRNSVLPPLGENNWHDASDR